MGTADEIVSLIPTPTPQLAKQKHHFTRLGIAVFLNYNDAFLFFISTGGGISGL